MVLQAVIHKRAQAPGKVTYEEPQHERRGVVLDVLTLSLVLPLAPNRGTVRLSAGEGV